MYACHICKQNIRIKENKNCYYTNSTASTFIITARHFLKGKMIIVGRKWCNNNCSIKNNLIFCLLIRQLYLFAPNCFVYVLESVLGLINLAKEIFEYLIQCIVEHITTCVLTFSVLSVIQSFRSQWKGLHSETHSWTSGHA